MWILNNVHFLYQTPQKIKLEEKMTTTRQCLKNVVFPGYSSARNQSTSKTKTKGPGGSAVKKTVGLAINEAIKKIESRRDVRKVIETPIPVYTCQIHCSLTTSP